MGTIACLNASRCLFARKYNGQNLVIKGRVLNKKYRLEYEGASEDL